LRRLKIPTLLGAFITLLDDRLGETIVLPLLPFLLEQFTTSATTLGFLTGTYAISQFAAAPLIGAMSDRFGRKPIMITCVSGSVIGICLFALTVSLNWDNYLPLSLLFLARIIDGISGGTAATATTILADISTPENRAKTFGLIGVAFGLGFILGPGLGTALAKFSVTLPVWVASGFAIFNLIFVIWFLPETLPKNKRNLLPRKRDLNPISQLLVVFKNPLARRLCLSFFVFFMAFNGFTAVLVLYLKEKFGWSPELCSAAFIVVGVIAMIVQGGLIGPLVKRFGESRLTFAGIGFVMTGCILLTLANIDTSIPLVFSGVAILAMGTGLVTPSLRALISRRLSSIGQGAVLGNLQGLQSLGTFLGAIAAGRSYDLLGPRSPFFGTILLLLFVMFLISGKSLTKKKVIS
jgi:DHA1 family tetracycline resistance protein-like MFS transporter